MRIGFLSSLDLNLYLARLPLMLQLRDAGHEVLAIVPPGEKTEEIRERGIRIVPYDLERASMNPLKELRTVRSVYRAVASLELDVLHTNLLKPNLYGTIAGRWAGVPRIVSSVTGLGSFFIAEDARSRCIRAGILAASRFAFRHAHAVVFENEDDAAFFVERRVIPAAKARVIRGTGIDTDLWRPVERMTSDRVVVTMVGRLIEHKGVREFVEAARQVRSRRDNVEFRLVGGPDPGNPSSIAESEVSTDANVTYLGQRSDVRELLADTDIFVLPSYREGLPRTGMEACSMGKPVVVTDTVGCREVVNHGVNGLAVPVRDAVKLAEAIEQLVIDPALRVRFGEKSREKAVREFALEGIIRQHTDLYGH